MADEELRDLLTDLFSDLPAEDAAEEETAAPESPDPLAKLRRHALYLRTASQVSSVASSILDLDELLPRAVDLIREEFGFYYVGLFLVDEAMEWAVLRAGTGKAGRQMIEDGHRLRVGDDSMIGWCLAHRQARIALDVGQEAVRFDNPLLPDTRSEMALPLVSRGRAIGAMTIQSAEPDAFSQEDITILQTMADQLANAVENARLLQERQRRVTEWAIVNEIGQAVSRALTLDELLELVHQQVGRLFDTTNFYIATYREGSDQWTSALQLAHGERQPPAQHSIEAGLTGHIIRYRQPLLFGSAEENLAFNRAHGLEILGEAARSWLGVPLVAADKLVGVMSVQDYERENLYDEQDLALFSTIAAQVAVALDNLRLLENTRRQAREMEVINEVGRTVTSVLDLDAVLRQIVDVTKARFGHYFVSVALIEGDHVAFRLGSTIGPSDVRLDPGDVSVDLAEGQGLIADAVRTGQPVLVNDVHADPRFLPVPELPDTRSELAMPIEVKGRVIGVLDMQSDRLAAYGQTDVALLQSLASQVGVAIENARLFEERERRITELAIVNEIGRAAASAPDLEVLLETVHERVGRLFDAKNFYIASHTEGSGEWTVLLEIEQGERLPPATHELGAGLTGYIIRNRRPLLLRNRRVSAEFHEAEGIAVLGKPAKSWMGVPLIAADQVVGVMAIQSYERENLYDEQDLSLFSTIAAQVASVLDSLRLIKETRRQAAEFEILHQVSLELSQEQHDLDIVLETITKRAMELLESDGGGVWLWREEEQALELVITFQVGEADFTGRRLEPGEGLTGRAFAQGRLQVIDDYPTWNGQSAVFEDAPFISGMAVPMIWQTEGVGALVVTRSERGHPYAEEDKDLAELLAAQAAAIIQNARLFEETQQRLEELTMLSRVSQALAGAPLRAEEIAEIIARQFVEMMDVPEASVSLPDPEDEDLMRIVADLYAQPEEARLAQGVPEAFRLADYPATTRALAALQPLVIHASDPEADPAELAYMEEYGTATLVVIPLSIKGRSIGVIELETWDEERQFTPGELDLAMTLANQAAVALENARLFEETQATLADTEALVQVSQRIASAGDTNEVLAAALQYIRRFDLDRCLAALLDDPDAPPSGRQVEVQAVWDAQGQEAAFLGNRFTPAHIPLIVQLGADDQVIVGDFATADNVDERTRATFQHLGVGAAAIVPLAVGGQLLGWFLAETVGRTRSFDPQEIDTLQSIAGQVAVALQNLRQLAAVQARARREQILREVTTRVRASTDPDTIMRTAVRELGTALGRPAFVRVTPPGSPPGDGDDGHSVGEHTPAEPAKGGE